MKHLIGVLSAVVMTLAMMSCSVRLDSLANFDGGGSNPLAFTTWDVFGREVSVGKPSDQVVVMFFNGKATSDAMQPITTEMAATFHDRPEVDYVNIVDMRTLAFYERPFAPSHMQGAAQRTIARTNARLEERGIPPIDQFHDHLFLIADENGAITQNYGVPNPDRTITCVVFQRNGAEIARFDAEAQFDEMVSTIQRSLDGQSAVSEMH